MCEMVVPFRLVHTPAFLPQLLLIPQVVGSSTKTLSFYKPSQDDVPAEAASPVAAAEVSMQGGAGGAEPGSAGLKAAGREQGAGLHLGSSSFVSVGSTISCSRPGPAGSC